MLHSYDCGIIARAPPAPHRNPPLSEAVLQRLRGALKDQYLVERELGEGGAATVYLARDIKHGRNVAIKVFRPELAETLGVDRFSREIRTAANLSNPHILTVLDSGSADGLLYYVMPYAEGESLRARISREGGLPIADVIRVLREVADALSTAHAAGVVHRDIKPDNVLLSGRHALVADFGVAKAISESSGRNMVTTVGVALGTPSYMAPEQAAADPHVDHRADIYALGILGYEMLVGEPPFVRRTPQEVLAAHVTEPAPPVSARRHSVPPALEAMIAKCLAKQAGDRYQAADEILGELERIGTPTAGVSPALGIEPTSARPAAVRPTPAPGVMRAVGIVAVAAVVLLAGWFVMAKLRGRASNANVVAVFPFEFSGASELAYLREGIVNVLEANLTGEGGPRAVASQTMIAQWKRKGGDKQGLTEDEARALARDLGAGQLLRGSIVPAGTDVVISASLAAVDGAGQSVQAQVKGPADSIASLATRLAGQLLSLRVGEASERLAGLQAVPPAALRSYLVGQQALRESRFLDAWNAFNAALSVDSTFALAAMGLNTAQSWSPVNLGAGSALPRAYRHRDRLGPRDLIILQMSTPTTFAGYPLSIREVNDMRERLVQQVSDRPEGWYLIGDSYFHRGTAMGLTREEALRRAENAFRRVLALDPNISYVKLHLAQMYLGPASLPRMKQMADSLGLVSPEVDATVKIMMGDSTDLARWRQEFTKLNTDQLLMVSFFTGGTPVGDMAYEQALSRSTDAAQRIRVIQGTRASLWAQGRSRRAADEHTRLVQLVQTPAQLAHQDVVLAGLFDDGDSTLAAESAAAVARNIELGSAKGARTAIADRAPALVVGLWAARVNDTATLRAAVARLDAIAGRRDSVEWASVARLFRDALHLVITAAPPDRAALVAFDSTMSGGPAMGAEFRSALNLIAARNWERLRDPARGARAAERASTWDVTSTVQITAQRDLGRLALAAGDTARAVRSWRDYLFNRGRAEPAQRKADDAIRATLAEIERRKR